MKERKGEREGEREMREGGRKSLVLIYFWKETRFEIAEVRTCWECGLSIELKEGKMLYPCY